MDDFQIFFEEWKNQDYSGESAEWSPNISQESFFESFDVLENNDDKSSYKSLDKYLNRKSTDTIVTLPSHGQESFNVKSDSEESLTHPCLKHLSVSDSELKFLNIYNFFPVPSNTGLNEAFWILYQNPPLYPNDGIDKFFETVKHLKLRPIQSLQKQFCKDTINLKYYYYDHNLIKPICESLCNNSSVKSLILQNTALTEESCYHLKKLFYCNSTISHLNLKHCKIGASGAKQLVDGIANSSSLTILILADCNLKYEGLKHVAKIVENSGILKELDISDNGIDEDASIFIEKIAKSTDSLNYLDLSWNTLNTKTAADVIFRGLSKNESIKELNLSWNSFGSECVYSLYRFLWKTKTLRTLNFMVNKFKDNDIPVLARSLINNKSLDEINLKHNHLTYEGVSVLLKALATPKASHCSLKLLNIESSYTYKQDIAIFKQIQENIPTLSIKLGGFLGNYELIEPDMTRIYFESANFEAMNQKKKRNCRDFGHFILSLPNEIISKEKFREKLQEAGVRISINLANEIMKLFPVGKKNVDLESLKQTYIEFFPEIQLPDPVLEEYDEYSNVNNLENVGNTEQLNKLQPDDGYLI